MLEAPAFQIQQEGSLYHVLHGPVWNWKASQLQLEERNVIACYVVADNNQGSYSFNELVCRKEQLLLASGALIFEGE
jgi:hypothetical protein